MLNNPNNRFDTFFSWVFSFYLGLSTIFWLPYVGDLEKYKVVVLLFLFVYFTRNLKKWRIYFPDKRVLFLLLALIFFFLLSQLFSGGEESGAYFVINILQIIVLVSISLKFFSINLLEKILLRSVFLFSIFAFLSLYLMLTQPGLLNPLNTKLTVLSSGLGGSRTSWSPSVAMFLPWIFVFLFYSRNNYLRVLLFLAAVVYIANQVLTQGRAGILSSIVFVFVFVFVFLKGYKRKLFGVFVLVLALLLLFIFRDYIRLGVDVEDFSNGRVTRNFLAIEYLLQSPILGKGYGFFKVNEGVTVHNVFLKNAVDSGLLVAIIMLGIIFRGLRVFKEISSRSGESAYLTLVVGVVCAMIEPSIIFGSFNASAFWWACFALVISKKKNKCVN